MEWEHWVAKAPNARARGSASRQKAAWARAQNKRGGHAAASASRPFLQPPLRASLGMGRSGRRSCASPAPLARRSGAARWRLAWPPVLRQSLWAHSQLGDISPHKMCRIRSGPFAEVRLLIPMLRCRPPGRLANSGRSVLVVQSPLLLVHPKAAVARHSHWPGRRAHLLGSRVCCPQAHRGHTCHEQDVRGRPG